VLCKVCGTDKGDDGLAYGTPAIGLEVQEQVHTVVVQHGLEGQGEAVVLQDGLVVEGDRKGRVRQRQEVVAPGHVSDVMDHGGEQQSKDVIVRDPRCDLLPR